MSESRGCIISKKFITAGMIAASAAIAVPAFADSHYGAQSHQSHALSTIETQRDGSAQKIGVELAQVSANAGEKSAAKSLDSVRTINSRSVSLTRSDEIDSLYARH